MASYRTVGSELLRLESSTFSPASEDLLKSFGQAVSPVGLEVLESYLEDLLDLSCPDEILFIRRDGLTIRSLYSYVAIAGLLFAIGLGIYATSSGAPFWMGFGLSMISAAPFAVLWHIAPRVGLQRRMVFAQILSQEIARRRGADKDGGVTSSSMELIFGGKKIQSMPGAAFSYHQ